MMYKVTKQYTRGEESLVAQFVDLNDAKLLITAKLEEDAKFKVQVTYRLLEGMEVLEEFTQANLASGSSGQGKSSTSTFKPTPFNAAPRPSGMPHSWIKDEDDKKKS